MLTPVPPPTCEVIIDAPRFSFIKRHDDGRIDFVSPLPCPFNYGSVPNTLSGDGDRIDALVMGARLPRGALVTLPVAGVVHFVDAGHADPKWICADFALRTGDRLQLVAFFTLYARAKAALNRARGKHGATRFETLELFTPNPRQGGAHAR